MKKKTKRTAALVLSLLMLAGVLAGCGAQPETPAEPTTAEATSVPVAEPAAEPAGTNLAELSMEELDELAAEMPNPERGVVFLKGTWYEMGRQFAKFASSHVKRTIVQGVANCVAEWGSVEAFTQSAEGAYETYRNYAPELIDLFQGIADESGFSYDEVFLTYNSLVRSSITDPEASEEARDIEATCNAAMAWGDATGGDMLVVNSVDRDKDEFYNPITFLYPKDPKYPEDTHAIVSHKGFLTGAVMNDSGLCLMGTGGQEGQPGDGDDSINCISPFPSMFVLAAKYDKADAAKDAFIAHYLPGAGNSYYFADADGLGYVVESVSGQYAVREQNQSLEGDRDYLIGNNQYFHPDMENHNSYDGTWDDCPVRFENMKYFLERDYGHVTVDTLREAEACTRFVDPETGHMTDETLWVNDPLSYYPLENVAPREKTTGRMIMNATQKTFYVSNGNEDELLSLIPNATGTYARFELADSIDADLESIRLYAYLYIYQGTRDISLSTGDTEEQERYLSLAKEQALIANNYLTFVNYSTDETVQLEIYGKAASHFALAQTYAKRAWNNPKTLLSDFEDSFFAF